MRGVNSADIQPLLDFMNVGLNICSAFVLVVALAAFVYNLLALGSSSTNIRAREKAKHGLILSGCVAVILPLTSVFAGIFIETVFLK